MLPASTGAVGVRPRHVALVLRRVAGHLPVVTRSCLVRFFTHSRLWEISLGTLPAWSSAFPCTPLDLERLRWEGPDPEKLRPLFAELEFSSLLRDLVPSGAAPEVEHTTPQGPEERRAALEALARAGAVAIVPLGARLEGLALAAPSGPVVVLAEPGARAAAAPRGAPAGARHGAAVLRARDAARRGARRDGAGRHPDRRRGARGAVGRVRGDARAPAGGNLRARGLRVQRQLTAPAPH